MGILGKIVGGAIGFVLTGGTPLGAIAGAAFGLHSCAFSNSFHEAKTVL